MLTVYHSNRLECLLEVLLETTAEPLGDPLQPERIIVQNQGMARWIAQQTAQRTGVAANMAFPLPARFFWEILRAWFPDAPVPEAYDREALVWRVLRLLPEMLGRPAFAPLQRYLSREKGGGLPAGAGPAGLAGNAEASAQMKHIANTMSPGNVAVSAPGKPAGARRADRSAAAAGPLTEGVAADGSPASPGVPASANSRGEPPLTPSAGGAGSANTTDLALYQLACRIADLFDQYLVFRPDRVLAWERGEEDHWQAELWRALAGETGAAHRAQLVMRLHRAMAHERPPHSPLPERVSLFGLTALAPVYVQTLDLLARSVPVHVFYLNPSRHYWGDLVDSRGQARRRAQALRVGRPDPTGLLDVGNPLLASMGHAGQVFLDQLLELGGVDAGRFVLPAGQSLLAQVQRDVLELVDPRQEVPRPERQVAANDRSVRIHSAHSRLREVQILHDRLLDLFEDLGDLEPRDVMVMAPDIDAYAPYVEAVFGTVRGKRQIPWAIADRRPRAGMPLAAALALVVRLPRSRLTASEVLSLLQVPAVQRRFGLGKTGLERLRTWIRESGVRWGTDEAMRAELGLPAERANTWDFGLDRLFLGYAMPPDAKTAPYRGVLPYTDIEGSEVEHLSVLQELLDALRQWRSALAQARPPAAWRTVLDELLTGLFDPDDDEEQLLQCVRERLDSVVQRASDAGFTGELSLAVVQSLVAAALEETGGAHRFLTGRVTFGNMVPMRSIPFRVVALLGMNDGDFPRRQHPLSFDLMAQEPRRGDRSRRRDDRYLFLEALLSARDVFHISYVGRDPRDDSVRGPAVVVSELLDYLEQGYALSEGGDLAAHLVVRHPLQPFSPRYFDGSQERLYSYAESWAEAARAQKTGGPGGFAAVELPPPDEALRTVDLSGMVAFLRNPAEYFLTERLRMRLPDILEAAEDDEPFDAAGLERYGLRQDMLGLLREGHDETSMRGLLRAAGVLPHGTPGELLLSAELETAELFLQRVRYRQQQAGELAMERLDVDLVVRGGTDPRDGDQRAVGGVERVADGRNLNDRAASGADRTPDPQGAGLFRLQGNLEAVSAGGLVHARLGKLRAKDRLRAWVYHLVLNLTVPAGIKPESVFVAEDATLILDPVPRAREYLEDLIGLRWVGLRAPVRFFPESAFAWLNGNETYGSTFEQAWNGGYGVPGESKDPAVRLAFRGMDLLGEEFEACARRILKPLQDHAKHVPMGKDLP